MTRRDPIRRYLADRGVRDDLVTDGLDGLVRRWAAIVGEVAHGYELTLDDYRNDMDVRDIIAGVLPLATGTQRQAVEKQLADADRRLRDVTTVSSSLWGDSDADGAAAERWWYFRKPRKPGRALAADLATLPD
jgi:ketosteroid isomerase-like protein